MKKVSVLALVVVLVLLAGGLYFWKQQSVSFTPADLLPEKALFYYQAKNVAKNLEEFRTSTFWQRMTQVDLGRLSAQFGVPAMFSSMAVSSLDQVAKAVNSDEFKKFFGDEVAIALYPIDINWANPASYKEALHSFAIITKVSGDVKAAQAVSELALKFKKNPQIEEKLYQKHKLFVIDVPELGSNLTYTLIKDWVIIGISERAAQQAIDVYKKNLPALSQDATFVRSRSHVLLDAEQLGYGDFAWIIDKIKSQLEKMVSSQPKEMQAVYQQQMKRSFDNFSGYELFVFSSGGKKPVSTHKSVWLFNKDKMDASIRPLFECAPKANASLKFIPADVLAYQWSSCVNAPYYWQSVKEELKLAAEEPQFEGTPAKPEEVVSEIEKSLNLSVDKDIIPAIGDEMGGFLQSLDTSGNYPIPQITLFVKVGDKGAMDRVLASLLSQPYMVVQNEDYAKHTIKYMSLPVGFKLEPAFTFVGDYLVLSINRDMIKQVIDISGNPALGLAQAAAFKAVDQGLSAENNSVFFMRMDAVMSKLRDLSEWGLQFSKNQAAQQSAFVDGSQRRLDDVKKSIEAKRGELSQLQTKADELDRKIAETAAQALDVSALETQKADLAIQVKAKNQAIELAKEQQSELEETLSSFAETPPQDPKQMQGVMQEGVYPVLKAFEAIKSIGSKMRFVNGQELETNVIVEAP